MCTPVHTPRDAGVHLPGYTRRHIGGDTPPRVHRGTYRAYTPGYTLPPTHLLGELGSFHPSKQGELGSFHPRNRRICSLHTPKQGEYAPFTPRNREIYAQNPSKQRDLCSKPLETGRNPLLYARNREESPALCPKQGEYGSFPARNRENMAHSQLETGRNTLRCAP